MNKRKRMAKLKETVKVTSTTYFPHNSWSSESLEPTCDFVPPCSWTSRL